MSSYNTKHYTQSAAYDTTKNFYFILVNAVVSTSRRRIWLGLFCARF